MEYRLDKNVHSYHMMAVDIFANINYVEGFVTCDCCR